MELGGQSRRMRAMAGDRRSYAASALPLADPAPASHPVDTEALLLLGVAVAARGQTARAAAILDRVARERPDEAHPCGELASLLPRLPSHRIMEQYRACLRLAPDDVRVRHSFARYLQGNGDAAEAMSVLCEGARLSPRSSAVQHATGVALAELGHIDDALRHLEQAVAIEPSLAPPGPTWACC